MIAEFSAPLAIIAAGQVMLLICGEIDLSVGNVFAFSAWIFYFANTDWNLPIVLAVIVGMLSGALVGLVNGLITVLVGVPSFITTLGHDLPAERDHAEHLGRVPRRDPGRRDVLPLLRRLAVLDGLLGDRRRRS